ncbi:MAG TPA: hypothetical protein VFB81_19035 [Myxococcales bacterium]|nr:hypothetical protein [Myxococcales bacterium]
MSCRRMMIRRRRRLPVTLGGRLPAITAEVSGTGFSAEMMQVFLPGSVVHGTICCGQRDLPFRGVVSWAEPGHPRLSIASRFGVRFTAEVEGLSELLEQNLPPNRPPLLRPRTDRHRAAR